MIFNIGDLESGIRPLYDSGDEKIGFTGGWSAFAPAKSGSYAVMYEGESTATNRAAPHGCQKNASNLKIYFRVPYSQDSWANGALGTANNLNLTPYKKLHIQVSSVWKNGTTTYAVGGVTSSKSPTGNNTPPGTYMSLSAGENVLDISGISSGYVYIGAEAHTTAVGSSVERGVTLVVTKIWLT